MQNIWGLVLVNNDKWWKNILNLHYENISLHIKLYKISKAKIIILHYSSVLNGLLSLLHISQASFIYKAL